MGDVVPLTVVPGEGYHAEADQILDAAKGKLTNALVIGWERDGSLYVAGSDGDRENLALVAFAQFELVKRNQPED